MMASDTRLSDEGGVTDVDKIYRVGNSILGICGDAMMARYFVEWFKTPKRNPHVLHTAIGHTTETFRCEIGVLELNPGGLFYWDGWGVPLRIRNKFYAIGSGSGPAMTIMHKSQKRDAPIEAVRYAMKTDQYTGGEIVHEWLVKPKKGE